MLDIFSQYATDETLENSGTWFTLGKGARVLVARAGNRQYSRALNKKVETHRAALDTGDDNADAVSDEIMADVMAETILLGWEGLSFKGEPMSYSRENARKLLLVKDFRRQIGQFADNFEAFKVKEEAAQGKA